jgi:hypothetical protein
MAAMRSVADDLRDDTRATVAALTPGERVALALALGARDVEAFRRASNPPPSQADAARLIERRRQAGRRPSPCAADPTG